MVGRFFERVVHTRGGFNVVRAFVYDGGPEQVRLLPDGGRSVTFQQYLTDAIIARNAEKAFDDLPSGARAIIKHSSTYDVLRMEWTRRREPTEEEQHETEVDAFVHRVLNHEMTLDDILATLKGKDIYNV